MSHAEKIKPPPPFYEDDAITLYHGNCLEILPTLGTFDHVIADPPYSLVVHSNATTNATISRRKDLNFDHLTAATRAAAAELMTAANRWILIFSDVESCHLWRADLEAHGSQYIRTGAWTRHACPQISGDRPAAGFETITITHRPGAKKWNGGGRSGVWEHRTARNGERWNHTTAKPLPLIKELVSLFTNPGDLIVDPFAGSGTTLRAAKDLGRRAIGIEQSRQHCDTIRRRMSQETFQF